MKISIVTISYNQAEFIERTIKSVITQKNDADIEYIVVDAGSTDGSREIIESYRDNIDHIIFEPDDGPADGLNKGFSYATGDIYGYLNSDDILYPSSLMNVDVFMSSNKGVDVISGHSFLIDKYDNKLRKLYSDVFNLNHDAYGASILIQPSTFFRASAFKESGGFNKKNKSNWDSELFTDFGILGLKFGIFDFFISGYRVHPESITGSMKIRDSHNIYNKERFFKIKKRDFTQIDVFLRTLYKFKRKIINYRDTYERIINGRTFGRVR